MIQPGSKGGQTDTARRRYALRPETGSSFRAHQTLSEMSLRDADRHNGGMNPDTKKTAPEFTPEERAAMKDRARELKSSGKKADLLRDLLDKIAAMPSPDSELATRIHEIVVANAPSLTPKLWYGMPAYADEGGKIVCFFQDAGKFSARYATLGFQDPAKLDGGTMWPTSYAITALTAADETTVAELVKKAVS